MYTFLICRACACKVRKEKRSIFFCGPCFLHGFFYYQILSCNFSFFFLGLLPLQGHNKRHKCIVCLHLPIMSSLWTLLSFCSFSLVVNPVPCITILPWCWKQRRSFVCHFPCFLIHTYVPSTRLLYLGLE